jgi:hypothetical protein
MYLRTIAIYSFLDDLLKAANHREDSRQQFTDAQVITVAVVAMLDFAGNFEKANNAINQWRIFSQPRLSRSRFSRRLNRLSDLLYLLFHQLGSTLKELNWESRYRLDSFPVPVCENIRIKRNRLTRKTSDKEQYRGVITSKKEYFFGVRVQVITTINGLPVEFAILPGACADIQGLAELPLDFPAGTEIAADSAYTEYLWEDHLLETDKIKLLVARKKNSKRVDEPRLKDYKFWLRHQIETSIGEVEKLFPKKIHATNLNGFLLKTALFLFAFQIDQAFIQ